MAKAELTHQFLYFSHQPPKFSGLGILPLILKFHNSILVFCPNSHISSSYKGLQLSFSIGEWAGKTHKFD